MWAELACQKWLSSGKSGEIPDDIADKRPLPISVQQQADDGADADDGKGADLLEIESDEGDDADGETFPVDEVFRGGKSEGGGADKSEGGGFQTGHDTLEHVVFLPFLIYLA